MRKLTTDEIMLLKQSNCIAEDWDNILVAEQFDAQYVRNASFYGTVSIGALTEEIDIGQGFRKHAGIYDAVLKNVTVGDNCLIEKVRSYILNYQIGNRCVISDVSVVQSTPGAHFGEGTLISVLNEVGDGNVLLFDGLNSQLAALMVKYETDAVFTENLRNIITRSIAGKDKRRGVIGNNVSITRTTEITNCYISNNCIIENASCLKECTLKSIPDANVYIGTDVICEDSVIYDGSSIDRQAKLKSCFVGEACVITNGFTADNSLFFANCYMSNGEACAAFCGPFTASHHKSTLLIGGMYSFYNAGSATNFSNHAYKMGPVHWGVLERGTKTASGSYILMPAQIGTFSVCYGKLMYHPDTRKLPFSYLFAYGDEMILVPGRNLTTVGLYRDIRKWPSRDKRPANAKNSIINFDWLSPFSVGNIMNAKRTLEALYEASGDVQRYNYHDYVIKNSSLKKGIKYYDIALRIYMGAVMKRHKIERPKSQTGTGKWSDLSGMLIPLSEEERIVNDVRTGAFDSVDAIRLELEKIHANYAEYRWTWSYRLICEYYGIDSITENDALRIQQDYITARRAWIAEIRKDAEKEYNLGDVPTDIYEEFVQRLDRETEWEKLKYDM